ncbi:MAG: hypothetical protein E6I22_09875 [Chloroflexi bacterium]|nr:MAG: hypothetical protein E6I22_09875 [Chloroflexota bacterium]TMG38571.1 MAG: hypothetical protein E6H92_05780 [Chloroflexota bacterium]
MLNSAGVRQRRIRLLDLYGSLLTEHQRRIVHLAWEEDWSYGEIAERESVSRTAIYDLVRRTALSLDLYERKLRLERQRRSRARSIDAVQRRLLGLERQLTALSRAIAETT